MSDTTSVSFQKGYKYRFYPNQKQQQYLKEVFGANRFLWNKLLEISKTEYELWKSDPDNHQKPNVSGYTLVKRVMEIKQLNSWMNDYPAVCYQQTALRLGQAFSNFFRNVKTGKTPGFPQFKNKYIKQSVGITDQFFRVSEGSFKFPKLNEEIRLRLHRPLPSKPTSCVVSLTSSGEYTVSFVCENSPEKTNGEKIVGLDMGITDLITLSDGVKISNPKHFAKFQKRLRRLQQSFSRKKKGSSNRSKAKRKVALCYRYIANKRSTHLHQLSRKLVNDSQVIGIETLNIKGMVRNGKLAKHITDASWGKLIRQLAYKARDSQHCSIVMMHPYFPSSHLCSATGLHLGRKLELSERKWKCPHCEEEHDRDVNAAQNIAIEAADFSAFYNLNHLTQCGKVYRIEDNNWRQALV